MTRFIKIVLALMPLASMAQEASLWRNPWSTNRPPMLVRGANNLGVTNASSPGTNWLFYGIVGDTVARLLDIQSHTNFTVINATNLNYGTGRGTNNITTNSYSSVYYATGGGTNYFGDTEITNNLRVAGYVQATNFYLTIPQWIDAPANLFWITATGGRVSVPVVDQGNGLFLMEFQSLTTNETLCGTVEAPHDIAVTNAIFPITSAFAYPHIHVRSKTNAVVNTNVLLHLVYNANNSITGTAAGPWTNTVQFSVGATSSEFVASFTPNNWTNFHPSIASTWSLTISRGTPSSNAYPGPIIVKLPSIHLPVGNARSTGSTTISTP